MTDYTSSYYDEDYEDEYEDEDEEEDQEEEQVLTQEQWDFFGRLSHQDIVTAAEEMEVSFQDVINWQRNPLFRACSREHEALLKQNVTQQVLLAAQNMMKMLGVCQEHVSFYERTRVLESVTRIIASITLQQQAIMNEQNAQDKIDAAHWHRHQELEEIHERNRRSAARRKAEAEAKAKMEAENQEAYRLFKEGQEQKSITATNQPTGAPEPSPSTPPRPELGEGLRGGVRATQVTDQQVPSVPHPDRAGRGQTEVPAEPPPDPAFRTPHSAFERGGRGRGRFPNPQIPRPQTLLHPRYLGQTVLILPSLSGEGRGKGNPFIRSKIRVVHKENKMTQAQDEARRRNALLSTGPKTEEGKAKARMNALKHGLRAQTVTEEEQMPEQDEQLDQTLQALMAHYQPQSPIEHMLVKRIAILTWRLERVAMAEQKAIRPQPGVEYSLPPAGALERILKYERTMDRELHRTIALLEAMRTGQRATSPSSGSIDE